MQEEGVTSTDEQQPEGLESYECESHGQQLDVGPVALGWPVAPDGFIPNSVIRNWGQNQELQEPKKLAEAKALQRVPVHKYLQVCVKDAKVRAQRVSKPATAVEPSGKTEPELEEEDISERLLERIAQSQWLEHKPKIIDLDSVVRAVMLTMDCMDAGVHKNCTEALLTLFAAYTIPSQRKKQLTDNLLKNIQMGNPHWKRLDGLEVLLQLKLLEEKDLFVLAEVLMDETQNLRQLARDGLAQVYSIRRKKTLLARLHNLDEAFARQKLIERLNTQLTEDLHLQKSFPTESPKPTESLSRSSSLESRVSTTECSSSVDYSPQNDGMSEERPEAPFCENQHPTQPAFPTDDVRGASSPMKHHPHRGRKKFAKFSVSLPERKIKSMPGLATEDLVDPLLMMLYKKLKTQHLAYSPSHNVLPPHPLLYSDSRHTASLPPPTQPLLFRLEPIKGRGDPNWRETLYQLTSTYGFRSQKARMVAQNGNPSAPEPPLKVPPFKLHPVESSQLSLGQRVVEELQVTRMSPIQFHHTLPLPWQLNVHTLDRAGKSQYGRLKMAWRAKPSDMSAMQLPPINPK